VDTFVARLLKTGKVKPGKSSYFFTIDETTKVQITLPPLAMKGPALNIIKMPNQNFTLEDMLKWKALDEKGKKILEDSLAANKGILVAGSAGSGKTTLLNILMHSIPLPQRIITLEHNGDLMVYREKVCRLKTEAGEPSEMVDLIKIAGRMRGDWYVMSYLNGPEVMPYIELLRTTAVGLACITGDNVFDAIKRLETKALISSEGQSLEDVRYAISQSFPVIVYQEKRPDGKRVVSQIAEVKYDSGELKIKVLNQL
jgi:pilus assembly protein CpaF